MTITTTDTHDRHVCGRPTSTGTACRNPARPGFSGCSRHDPEAADAAAAEARERAREQDETDRRRAAESHAHRVEARRLLDALDGCAGCLRIVAETALDATERELDAIGDDLWALLATHVRNGHGERGARA